MELASAIVGLLAVGTQVYSTLNTFVSTCQDAPFIAQTTRDEVRDFHYALTRLRDYVWKRNQITPLGRATTDTSQLILTLASSMTTFARIEKILNRLLTQPKMDYIHRIRWALSDGDLAKLLMRIQQHKATLNLLLTIWLSESAAQAETSNDILNDTLKCLLDPKQKSNLQSFDPTIYDSPICDPLHPNASPNIPNPISSKGGNGDTLSIRTVDRALSVISGKSLASKLRNSKVYAGARAFDSSAMSVSTSQRATPWSSFTIGSNTSVFSLPFSALDLDRKTISDVEEIRQVSLPLGALKLYNDWWYPESNITFDIPLGRTCSLREVFGLGAAEKKTPIDKSPEPPSALKYTPDLALLIRQLNQQLSSHIAKGQEPHSFLHQQLHQAINKPELSSVEVLLFLSAHNRFGPFIIDVLVDAFREAVAGGNEFIAKLFLDWGKWIEVPHQQPDYSILALALTSQCLGDVSLFLAHGVDTEKGYGSPPYTLLQGAAIGRFGPLSPNVAALLLDQGVNIEGHCEEEHREPLELAIETSNYEMVSMLLERGANPDKACYLDPPCTPLQAAVMGLYVNSPRLAQFLLDKGVNIEGRCEEERRKPLELAIESSNYEMISMLLERGANPDKACYLDPPCTPLQAAVMGLYVNSPRLAQFLLDKGVNIEGRCEEERRKPLELAIESSNYEMISMLLERGANPDKACYLDPPCTPLQAAVMGLYVDSLRLAQFLLDKGVNIEGHCEEERRKPLELAIRASNYEMMRILLDHGADPEKAYGIWRPCTPLQEAAKGLAQDSLKVAQFLLERGVNIEGCCNEESKSPLHLAIDYANYDVFSLLLKHGADPNKAYGNPKRTPLQVAAGRYSRGGFNFPKDLLNYGANIKNYTDDDPRTPLQIAVQVGNKETATLLIAHGANYNHTN